MDENGGIGIEVDEFPHLIPFCPKCETPTLVQMMCSDRLVCLRCGSEFEVEFKEVVKSVNFSKKNGEEKAEI